MIPSIFDFVLLQRFEQITDLQLRSYIEDNAVLEPCRIISSGVLS